MFGFCNMLLCVCEGFLMCGFVYECILLCADVLVVGFVM